MPYSRSRSFSMDGDFKNFKEITRERLLNEMLGPEKAENSLSSWKVLVTDKLTVKIMSSVFKLSEITQEGVSLVEDISRHRQPMVSMEAIYFIQPTEENVTLFLADMKGKSPQYKKASVYFSSPISRSLVTLIKKDLRVMKRIAGLKEMNLEYIALDSQGFVTDNENALEDLFCDEENPLRAEACLNMTAKRIATVLASLREYPTVHYRAVKTLDASTVTTFRELIPTKIAAIVWNYLERYRQKIEDFPQTETCELLILDRSIDQIAPFIHEWTYDAMCHDLLDMDGKKYTHEVPGKSGDHHEKKEVLLDEDDPIWLELRDTHIADASERLHEKMTTFVSKNKAAQMKHGSSDFGDISSKDLRKMVQALPQYSEQIDKLSLHVEIAGKINRTIMEQHLREIGKLEQDLVFGDVGRKAIIKFLSMREDISRDNKLRLLMILAAIDSEKFKGEKGRKIMELAKLSSDDIETLNNMRLLGAAVAESKKISSKPFSFKFGRKNQRGVRKDRIGETQTWQLSRFYPIIEEIVEKLSNKNLPKQEYSCMNEPSQGVSQSQSASVSPVSVNSRRTPTWATRRLKDDGYASDSVLRQTSSSFKRMGPRILVFIVGGATRSELRVCHKLTQKLNREVILGSTSFDDPQKFISKMKRLKDGKELSLEDIKI